MFTENGNTLLPKTLESGEKLNLATVRRQSGEVAVTVLGTTYYVDGLNLEITGPAKLRIDANGVLSLR